MRARAQTRLSDFSEYRTKDDMQLTELGTIKASASLRLPERSIAVAITH
jgi:hypothetical protein